MAEKSMPWTENGIGDGTSGGYTAIEWSEMWRRMFNADPATQCVHSGFAGECAVSGTSSPLNVATGALNVYGKHHWNDSAKNLTVSTPTVGTTGGHVIAELTWASQTVRIVAVRNTDGLSAVPALTQSTSTVWQVRLATFTITTGGAITLTDVRGYLHYNTRIDLGQVDGGTSQRIPFFDSAGRLTGDAGLSYEATTDRVRTQGGAPGFWADETGGGAKGALLVLDDGLLQVQRRATNFGAFEASPLTIDLINERLGIGDTSPDYALDVVGQIEISPASAAPPFILGTNGQGQQVDGLHADEIDTLAFRRQGGNAGDWSVSGTTNYTPTALRIQAGIVNITVFSGGQQGGITLTLPAAFGNKFLIFATATSSVNANGQYIVNIDAQASSSSQASISVLLNANAGSNSTFAVQWWAIGPE